ncbi:MAG: nucleotidyltransferase domain-containing protein [Gammaproteobacteria bacterium]|nr:nucleotidyltransferase domain-containing protein [Gammaproteobacteria bacterium]
MKYGLKAVTISHINRVFLQFPSVEKVLIYGSRAKGTEKLGSDIDLTLIGESIRLEDLLHIDGMLDDLMLPYTFDLSIYKHIDNLDLIEHIQRVGLVFYEKEL